MTLALLCAATGGVSIFGGVGWHNDFPGADPVYGVHAHFGYRPAGTHFAFVLVVQALTLSTQNNDEEFPNQWRRSLIGIGPGVQLEAGPYGLQLSLGEGILLETGGNDSGLQLTAVGFVAVRRWLRLETILTHWFVTGLGHDIGVTTLSAGIGACF